MSYCAVDDVQAIIPTTLWNHDGSSPSPTEAQVEDFIADVDEYIDAKLSRVYTVPITGTKALRVVNSISTRLTAIRVYGTIFTGHTGEESIPKDWLHARTELDELADGDATLSDAESSGASTSGSPGSPAHTFPPLKRDETDLDESYPTFDRDTEW